ncbi:hypothetical protein M758_4G129700 [Ceratodon purpureus]|nr:hypothetical protein M758_4G129700 [Ceratodon purpureus]
MAKTSKKAQNGCSWTCPKLLSIFHHYLPQAAIVALLSSPRKHPFKFGGRAHITSCWLTLLTLFTCASMLRFLFLWPPAAQTSNGCTASSRWAASLSVQPLSPHHLELKNLTALETAFWKQPDGAGYVPCIDFTTEFKSESVQVVEQREKYLIVVVSGGLNQQRNQIVDSVVMARILGAALVVPIMRVDPIWEDESEFGDIFDTEHFRETLKDDVRIVSSVPSTHIMFRPLEEKETPLNASPRWLRAHYRKKMNREGVLLLRGLDSRLAKDLPSDLQKLRCKVAFHALKFAAPIQELGMRLAERMWSQGPYLAIHLRLETDVWVRTGCLPGLGKEFDEQVRVERKMHPKLLTARGARLGFTERKMAGLCPLTGAELARLLKALGASRRTRIYWAGGEPLGGQAAIEPLMNEFPQLFSKANLATSQELEPFKKKASSLAAIDYLVCLSSDVFMPSHGGNFGHVMQGHRAYMGHRKHITPNKRQMIAHFLNSTISSNEFDRTIRSLHEDAVGKSVVRANKSLKLDVLADPVPQCMCQKPSSFWP